MKTVERAGGIVVNPFGGILVIQNQIGKCTFPKGESEGNEIPIETAEREIREEGGLHELEIVRYLGILTREGYTATNIDAPSVIKRIKMFHCTTRDMELGPFMHETVAAEWVVADALSHVLSWPQESDFFDAHRSDLGL